MSSTLHLHAEVMADVELNTAFTCWGYGRCDNSLFLQLKCSSIYQQ